MAQTTKRTSERLLFRISQNRPIRRIGIIPLFEFPWDDNEDDLFMCEHVRKTGLLECDTLGSIWGGADPSLLDDLRRRSARKGSERRQRERQLAREKIADREWREEEKRRELEKKRPITLPKLELPRAIKWEFRRQSDFVDAANDNNICTNCGAPAPFPYRGEWYCDICIDAAAAA
jgi:hypothetical protein